MNVLCKVDERSTHGGGGRGGGKMGKGRGQEEEGVTDKMIKQRLKKKAPEWL